jgi:hypothetical protein
MRRHVSANRLHSANYLVAGHDGDRGIREFPVDDVEVGAANPAREDLHENVSWPWRRLLDLE